MKKTLCCLLALLLLFSSAMADTLITGEVVEIPNPGDVRVLLVRKPSRRCSTAMRCTAAARPTAPC